MSRKMQVVLLRENTTYSGELKKSITDFKSRIRVNTKLGIIVPMSQHQARLVIDYQPHGSDLGRRSSDATWDVLDQFRKDECDIHSLLWFAKVAKLSVIPIPAYRVDANNSFHAPDYSAVLECLFYAKQFIENAGMLFCAQHANSLVFDIQGELLLSRMPHAEKEDNEFQQQIIQRVLNNFARGELVVFTPEEKTQTLIELIKNEYLTRGGSRRQAVAIFECPDQDNIPRFIEIILMRLLIRALSNPNGASASTLDVDDADIQRLQKYKTEFPQAGYSHFLDVIREIHAIRDRYFDESDGDSFALLKIKLSKNLLDYAKSLLGFHPTQSDKRSVVKTNDALGLVLAIHRAADIADINRALDASRGVNDQLESNVRRLFSPVGGRYGQVLADCEKLALDFQARVRACLALCF